MFPATLQHFEVFLAVAETGSFTQAAKNLGNSKAYISQTIRNLEDSLELPLFIRTTRKVSLTEEGELLLAQCLRLHDELDAARNLLGSFKSSPSGTLKIIANPYFAENVLPELVLEYVTKFPAVKLEILAEERIPDLHKEQIDIVFGVNWQAPDDVVAKKIGATRYVICASPKYLTENTAPNILKDLEQHKFISHLGRDNKTSLVNLKNHAEVKLPKYICVSNASLLKQFAIQGMGIVQLHEYVVAKQLASGELVEVLNEYSKTEITLYMYYQKHRFVQPKIRQFVNLCNNRPNVANVS